jgi:hypothetical protein
MKPELENYRIIPTEQGYDIQHKYDLFTGFDWHTVGVCFTRAYDAQEHLLKIYNSHCDEYHRLQKLGRGFPDND